MAQNEGLKKIDVSAALKAKNPKLYQKLPRFAIRWIEKLIHQDEINIFLHSHGEDNSIEFATHAVEFLNVEIQLFGEDNIPETGRYIMVSNHPLGGLDGLSLISTVGKVRKDIKFPVNDLLMQIPQMRQVFTPINKYGKNSHDAVKQFDEIFASDNLILYFPAGLCSRKQHGEICDLDWKKTIVTKARQHQRDIIPVYFDGRNSNRFYNIANLRKRIGLKFNYELALLPDEMFRQRGQKFGIIFGEPIPYTTFDNSKTDKEWVDWLKEKVYALKSNKKR